MSVQITCRISPAVDARLRQVAGLTRKRIGEVVDAVLNEALPQSAEIAARITAQGGTPDGRQGS